MKVKYEMDWETVYDALIAVTIIFLIECVIWKLIF